jgi:hydrogenase/urease accessory protein HupE
MNCAWRSAVLLVFLTSMLVAPGIADDFRPAYLELHETAEGRFDVTLKVPALGEQIAAPLEVEFPPGTRVTGEFRFQHLPGAAIRRWQIERAAGLDDQVIALTGVSAVITDVLARVERRDGTSQVERLLPERPSFVVKRPAGAGEVAWTYLVFGVEHILEGVDHLLFVLALLLVVRGGRRIFFTITAFTIAHSMTLAAATLGFFRVPGPPVEATIALSIMFVASEAVQGLRGRPGLTSRAPWLVAFVFGLLHGLGFASALAEVGLPQASIPLALLMFNIGVELGQLAFVAAVLLLRALLTRGFARLPRWTDYLPAYAIGTIAMFWVTERVLAFVEY